MNRSTMNSNINRRRTPKGVSKILCIALSLMGLLTPCATAQAEDEFVFFFSDAQGTAVSAYSESGALCWEETYSPYGKQLTNNDGQRKAGCGFVGGERGYTGHTQDSSGLVYMQQRYYDPTLARFMSIDPVSLTPQNPSTYTRYAYAFNSPFNFVDPDGREARGFWESVLGFFGGNNAHAGEPGDEDGDGEPDFLDRDYVDLVSPSSPLSDALDNAGYDGGMGRAALKSFKTRQIQRRVAQMFNNDYKHRFDLRNALKTNGTGKVAHHVIPLEMVKQFPKLMKKAAVGGFNMSGKNNGYALDRPDHVGGHPNYNRDVADRLRQIDTSQSPGQVAREIQGVANTLKKAMDAGTYGPWR